MIEELEQFLLDLPRWIKRVLRKEARKAAPFNPLDGEAGRLGPIGFTGRELMEGLIAIGGKGSGKTSCLAWLLYQLYAAGWCGHILCVKTEELDHQLKLLKAAGREKDVVLTGPGHPNTISALAYEFVESGCNVEAIAQFIGTMMAVFEGHGGKSHDSKAVFWERSALNAARMSAVLLAALGPEHLNLVWLAEVIKTAPTEPAAKQEPTLFWAVWTEVKKILNSLPAAKKEDAERAFAFFTGPWARLAEETRSGIVATLSSMTELFSLSPLRELFCEATTVRPRDCWEQGKILIHVATIHGNGIAGKMQQSIWKYLFMRDAERRIPSADSIPCFQIEDEFQGCDR